MTNDRVAGGDALGRRRHRQWRREASALLDAKTAILDEHGADLSLEARRAAFDEISKPAYMALWIKHLTDAQVERWVQETLAEGGHVRIATAEGDWLVAKANVTDEHRQMIRAARIRRKLARAGQRKDQAR